MSQVIKKFIGANQVDQTKVRLDNNTALRGRNAANSADINILKVNTSDRIEFSSVPQQTADGVAANDTIRFSQFSAALDGLKPKAAVNVASTVNGVLATDFHNGSIVDGVTLTTGMRILIWQQTAPAENGIYTVNASGAPTRATDFDAPTEIPGAYTVAESGTLYTGVLFVSTSSPGTIGVDPINFAMRVITPGANTSLSNLVSTAINQDLNPDAPGTRNIGSTAFFWQTATIAELFDTSGVESIDVDNRRLFDHSNIISEDYGIRQLYDSAGGLSLDWSNGSILVPTKPIVYSNMSGELSTAGATQLDLLITTNNGTWATLPADTPSGNINVSTGATTGTGQSGQISISTAASVDGNSGAILLSTGVPTGTGTRGDLTASARVIEMISSADMTLQSGDGTMTLNTVSAGPAPINIATNAGGLAVDAASGSLNLSTGATTGTGVAADVSITAGSGVNGNSGNIILAPGVTSGTGTSGVIKFANSGATVGWVWTATNVDGSGAYMAPVAANFKKDLTVLSSGDITNQYVDLSFVAITDSISFVVQGGPNQVEGASYDYSVNYTGGAGGVTRITFLNGLATGGLSALVAGDVVVAQYTH